MYFNLKKSFRGECKPRMYFNFTYSFAVETPLAGTEGAGAVPFAGLMTPTAEVGAVLGEKGGLPPQAVPQGLPERLAASLQGEQPLVQG